MKKHIILLSTLLQLTNPILAQNPIIQTSYTADPAPVVHNDTVYLFTSHDDDEARGFLMKEWLLYTSTDMVNWTDHGAVASLKDFKWASQDNGAWAPQAIERDGKWYMYCPIQMGGIGVLTADSPYGPWSDPLGKQLVMNSMEDIDPTVYIDKDGQAYMYWGNPNLYCVKLNRDMISYDKSFGDNGIMKCEVKPDDYQEGPWMYKRGKYYYMAYASTCCPEGIGYSMSKSPLGPWRQTGTIMGHYHKSSGNHPGIIDYKGKTYVFGFSYILHRQITDVHCERRSVCLSELKFNDDGTIVELPLWDELPMVEPVGAVDAFSRIEAETMAWSDGVKTARRDSVGMVLTDIHNNDYIKLRNVDFKEGATGFEVMMASMNKGGEIELRIDRLDGPVIGTCRMDATGEWNRWELRSCKVEKVGGCHDLFLVFKGSHKQRLFDIDWQRFKY